MQLIFRQAIKFILVGILNTVIDLGILNVLILISGVSAGLGYSIFKGISFAAAVINSYFLNKFWTFQRGATGAPRKEFTQFFIASVIGFGINVSTASFVVNFIGPQLGVGANIWANVGAILATLTAMFWNFLAYKFIVFKK
jgi:putative flippase GtrA